VRWIIDGNNVFGSRPDGWWNDRDGAAGRFAQQVAEWCRTHADEVTIVFDGPVSTTTSERAGGNLEIVEAPRRGRDAADDHIVDLVGLCHDVRVEGGDDRQDHICVVTSDRGLRRRLPASVEVAGAGRFLSTIESHPSPGDVG